MSAKTEPACKAELQGKPASSFHFTRILYEKYDGRAKITINRPEIYNAFDFQTFKEMTVAVEDASFDDTVGVLILTGAGDKAFCTGADLKEQSEYFLNRPHDYWKWMGGFIDLHDKLRNIGKPTIARLNGMVVGGGNELNMACDLAVAAEDVYIRQVGTARGSVPAAGATQWLPLIVGDRRAREILWLCEEIPAQKAMEWGLINQVVPRDKLDEAVEAMADKLLQKLPDCMRYTKQQTNFWRDFSWSMTVPHARDWLTIHTGTYETFEGTRAFVEKRPIDYASLRSRATSEASSEFLWGPNIQQCPVCNTDFLPNAFQYCGHCGASLK
jgi:enoyl-CoA hydratase/carnithine racemase